MRNTSKANFQRTRGFTLIELIVVVGILALLTTIILANHQRFGGQVLLRNFAYDVGLSIREAQVYGIAVKRFGTDEYDAGYGIYFNKATPTEYVLFADIYPSPGNGAYDAGQGELVKTIAIQRGFQIDNLCATSASTETCGLNILNIHFKRPEPDAFIKSGSGGLRERGRIVLESPRGDQISVVVEATGQIAVQ